MPKDLLLMFAYHFPPENVIGAARPHRFSKYLSRLDVRTHTITAADVSTCADLDAETVPDPFVTHARQGMGWQVERAIRKFVLPGACGSQWALKACEAACRFLDSQTGTNPIVLSTYPPSGTPCAGYLLARKRGLPWILDLRDPMGDSPLNQEGNFLSSRTGAVLEKFFISAADCVLANTDAAQARLQALYPAMARKIHLLWNGFDPEDRLTPLPIPSRGCRVYSHIGELYEGRVITPLLMAMDRLVKSGRVSPEQVVFQLVGPIRSTSIADPTFMSAAQEKGWLRVTAKQVSKPEAQQLMRESDGLLLVQPSSTLQVPAKLFEYVQIGRPVLAYLLPNTPAERILIKSNTPTVFAYSDRPGEDLEEALLRFFALDSQPVAPSAWFEQQFNAQDHANQLLHLMRDLRPSTTTNGSKSVEVY